MCMPPDVAGAGVAPLRELLRSRVSLTVEHRYRKLLAVVRGCSLPAMNSQPLAGLAVFICWR